MRTGEWTFATITILKSLQDVFIITLYENQFIGNQIYKFAKESGTRIMEKLPNFLVVGAAKSGTTSLFRYLKQHPEIGMGRKKEGKFFSQMPDKFNGTGDHLVKKSLTRTFDEYKKLYAHITNEKVIGDVSPEYLYFYENSIFNIKNYLETEPKIIIILRNPVEKTFSQYSHLVRDGRETLSFDQALSEEKKRMEQGWEWTWYYQDTSFYFNQVKAYLDAFSKEKVKILLNEDLDTDSLNTIKNLCNFLEVNENFIPDVSTRWNTTKSIRLNTLSRFLNDYNHPLKKLLRPVFLNTIGKNKTEGLVNFFKEKNTVTMKPETKMYLSNLYKNDIVKLQELIERDLSAWITD